MIENIPGVGIKSQIGTTRKSCSEETMAAENRFFAQLSTVKKFGFMLGK